MSDNVSKVLDAAVKHNGRFLLPRRLDRRPLGTVPDPDEDEKNWEACRTLVENGHAIWLSSSGMAPGIELVHSLKRSVSEK